MSMSSLVVFSILGCRTSLSLIIIMITTFEQLLLVVSSGTFLQLAKDFCDFLDLHWSQVFAILYKSCHFVTAADVNVLQDVHS